MKSDLWRYCYGWLTTSSALFICGMSEGEEPALQGLATSLIDHAYHARLFTSVAVVEILAKLIGGPMMGKLFSIGHAKSSGVCFSVSAVSRSMFLGAERRLKRCCRSFSLFSWSLHVYKGSNVEEWGRWGE